MEDTYNEEIPYSQDVLNTGSICFLCLNDIFPSMNLNEDYCQIKSEPESDQSERFQILTICRYLNLNVHGFGETSSRNISVNLCQECKGVAGKLTNLCAELEILQMKVDNSLQTFSRIMDQSEQNPEGVEKLQETLPTTVNNLREKLQRKCTKKLRDVIPKVKLTREKLDCIKKLPSKTVTTLIKSEVSDVPNSNLDEVYWEDDGNSEISNSNDNDQFTIPANQGRKAIQTCNICNRKLQIQQLLRHKSNHHFESFFIQSKLPELSMEHFKLYCEHVFKVEILSCAKIPNPSHLPRRQCPHCSANYSDKHALRIHLFSAHQEILSRKIVALQESSSVEEILEMSVITGNDGIKCDACGKTFTHDFSFRRHKKRVCKFRPRIMMEENDGKPLTCTACGMTLSNQWNFKRHKDHTCKYRQGKPLEYSVTSEIPLEIMYSDNPEDDRGEDPGTENGMIIPD